MPGAYMPGRRTPARPKAVKPIYPNIKPAVVGSFLNVEEVVKDPLRDGLSGSELDSRMLCRPQPTEICRTK